MKTTSVIATIFAAAIAVAPAVAKDFPDRPIEIIVNYSAGGGTDLNFRALASFLQKELSVPVVVVNKPGAGGVVGLSALARSEPDGYTVGSFNIPAMNSAFVAGNLQDDPIERFDFIGAAAFDAITISVPSSSQFKTLTEVIEYLKANPNGLTYAATGKLGTDGLTAQALQAAADVHMRMVMFEGGNESVTAALGGHVDLVGLTVSEGLSFAKDGSLKVLAVGGSERNPFLPDVPTFEELGIKLQFPGTVRGLIVPAGIPDDVRTKLGAALEKAAQNPEYVEATKKFGLLATYENAATVEESTKSQIEWLKANPPQ